MFPEPLRQQAAELLDTLAHKKMKLVTAESCTGGLLAGLFTEIAGASEVFERGYVTYSNESKSDLLRVPHRLISVQGAVSEQVASAMAQGALTQTKVDITVAITGVAGPGGGSAEKPVGLVYIALATKDGVKAVQHHFHGERSAVRMQSVAAALAMLKEAL